MDAQLLAKIITALSERGLGIILSLATRALEAVSKFGLYALAARLLGGDASGRFFLCLSIVHFTATFARMGLEKPLTRHVAAELAVGQSVAARRKAIMGTAAILGASLLVALLLSLAAGPIAHLLFRHPELERALRLAALIVPLNNLAFACAYLLIGLDRGAMAQLVMNALVPVLSLGALMLGADDLDRLLLAYGGAFALSCLLGIALIAREWRRMTDGEPAPDMAPEPLPSLWASARPLFIVELGQAGLLSLPILVLGRFAAPLEVSEFSIANRLSMLVSTVVLSIGAIVAPAYARHYRRGEFARLRKVDRQIRSISMAVCLPMIAAMLLGAYPLLQLLGSASDMSVRVLWILAFGQLLFCLLPCQDVLLAMTGHGDVLRRLMLVQLAVCISLCLALIPAFGALGGAVASMAAWAITAIGSALAVRRLLPEMRRRQEAAGEAVTAASFPSAL
ncbi:lipopolysaccharide biosynthesis protein [Sphingomonas oleivorans]|nr:oligosaccharide flippase family protein [Sphingomonas oleivorans]